LPAFSANGQRDANQNTTLDGVVAVDSHHSAMLFSPSIEAIEEFKIQSAVYSAEYGMNSGAQANLAIKSGANSFHGTAFEFLRNDAFDARGFFLSPTAQKNKLRRNQFGSVLSGPAVGAIVGTWLLDAYGWRPMFILTGLAGAVWVLPWWMIVPDGKPSAPAGSRGGGASLRTFLRTKTAWGLAGSVFFYSYYWYFFLSWIPAYLVLKHDMPNLRMGLTMAAPLAGMAVVNLGSGALADLVIRRKGGAVRVRRLFVCVGFLGASLLMALAWVEKGGPLLPITLISLMGVGIGAGNYWALSQAVAPRAVVGRALGFQNMVAQIAGAAAPLATGILLGPSHEFRTAIIVAGACPLVSIAAIVLLVRTGRAGLEQPATAVTSSRPA
jgi:MFS family permease